MKTTGIIYTALVTLLICAITSFGTIISSGDSSSYAFAYADSSDTYDDVPDSGSYQVTTDTAGTFNWSYTLSVETEARMRGSGGGLAVGQAIAEVSGVTSKTISCYSSVTTTGLDEDNDYYEDSGQSAVGQSGGLFFDHAVRSTVSWSSGSSAQLRAISSANVTGSMW